ncbi:hypothetical protein CALCODRAFT_502833 [Calocera cornea HHB12733]|uniref:DUF1917-domain-containing protein n=1 Tax=Calocera cornea HHB12733 TaxID=1353952 RepID=A0A165D3B5_9BASI|nr:hypothetical protein CALCODRAFT_502833 [Calocera cornea HHB12733]
METDSETSEMYRYRWTPSHELSLERFLSKYKPSRTKDDGRHPWIWIERPVAESHLWDEGAADMARGILAEATEKVLEIKRDRAVPWHADGETGVRSKQELQEEVRAQAVIDIERICRESGATCGKWIFFVPRHRIDRVWLRLARSVVEGDLATTVAWEAKVSTVRTDDTDKQHLICLYLPNIYEKKAATEVLEVLVGQVGLTPMHAKPDMYTHIGLYTKHPSGIRPTIWKAKDLLSEEALQELQNEYGSSHRGRKQSKAASARRCD